MPVRIAKRMPVRVAGVSAGRRPPCLKRLRRLRVSLCVSNSGWTICHRQATEVLASPSWPANRCNCWCLNDRRKLIFCHYLLRASRINRLGYTPSVEVRLKEIPFMPLPHDLGYEPSARPPKKRSRIYVVVGAVNSVLLLITFGFHIDLINGILLVNFPVFVIACLLLEKFNVQVKKDYTFFYLTIISVLGTIMWQCIAYIVTREQKSG